MFHFASLAVSLLGTHESNTTEYPTIHKLLRFEISSEYVVLNPALFPPVAWTLIYLEIVLFGRFLKDADVQDRKLRACNLRERHHAHESQDPKHTHIKLKSSRPIAA